MKTLLTLSAAALIFSVASAQEKTTAPTPQPLPMAAPAMKTQNAQQNSQNATAPKQTGTATDSKKAAQEKDKDAAAPPVDNKIAVSDPGVPSDKSNKKATGNTQSEEKKTSTGTGISPK